MELQPGDEIAGVVVSQRPWPPRSVRAWCGCGALYDFKRATLAAYRRQGRPARCPACRQRGGRPAGATRATGPATKRAAEAVRLLREGVPHSVVAKSVGVSVQTVEVWWLRWVVYPEWLEMRRELGR